MTKFTPTENFFELFRSLGVFSFKSNYSQQVLELTCGWPCVEEVQILSLCGCIECATVETHPLLQISILKANRTIHSFFYCKFSPGRHNTLRYTSLLVNVHAYHCSKLRVSKPASEVTWIGTTSAIRGMSHQGVGASNNVSIIAIEQTVAPSRKNDL